MGSATPSLEAYHLARQGGMVRHDLTRRLSGGELPKITVVDMKKETGVISKSLASSLRRVEEEGRQSILFLNRRGFSTFFHCRSCGYEMVCRHCSVGLTFHKNRNRMVCHYCGFSQAPVDVCPSCGSFDVGYSGFGTEAVEEELRRLFPDIPATRMDTDTVSGKGNLEEKLEEFRSGRTRLLLGTQMVAKGLNFPGVKLVGIILADTGLHLPDFRAAERSFALMHQVAGRAGRYTRDGEVIIQTYRPDHPAVTAAAWGSLEEFYEKELDIRQSLGFPPYARLFRITLRGKDPERVKNGIEILAGGLRDLNEDCFELLGPAECPLSLISGNYRHHFLVRTTAVPRTRALLREVLSRWSPPPGTYLEVDPDPVNLL
jgi:primosomal protein N' (replication factor Y)